MANSTDQAMNHEMSKIFFAIAAYWIVSLSMVFANKTLLGNPDAKTAPLFITWYQCVITVIVCSILGKFNIGNVPKFEIKKETMKGLMPLSIVFVCMILFNNLCLKYVEVSFYQVARSLTTVFNVIFDYILLGYVTSLPAIGCCGLLIFGFLLGNDQEIHWSFIGFIFGLSSSFFVAMNSIFMKKKLPLVNQDVWKIAFYNNFNAMFLFLPLVVLSGEIQILFTSDVVRRLNFWFLLTCSGLLGVAMSIAYAGQVKYTSPLTHNVSATAKSAAQTLIALAVYGNPINKFGLLSVAVVLLASLLYGMVRNSEMKRKAAEQTTKATMTMVNGVDTTKDPLLEQESESTK